jgi:uncharacterized membrane protein
MPDTDITNTRKIMILYCGDNTQDTAASYLQAIMQNAQLEFSYLDSTTAITKEQLEDCECLILSDYPSANINEEIEDLVIEKVKCGMGFLMIGGWESFHGKNGEYNHRKLRELLPVECLNEDDRRNFSQPCLMITQQDHEIVKDLSFQNNPPMVGGLNEVICKKDSTEIISARSFSVDGDLYFKAGDEYPLLVISEFEDGRCGAFMSDVAPHWVGGFVDWGTERVIEKVHSNEVEVGDDYCKFFQQLILWCSKRS